MQFVTNEVSSYIYNNSVYYFCYTFPYLLIGIGYLVDVTLLKYSFKQYNWSNKYYSCCYSAEIF